MIKHLLTTFNFKTFSPLQKYAPVLTYLQYFSTKSPEVKSNVVSILKNKPYKERLRWNDQDTDKLLKLIEEHGPKWKSFLSYFPKRTAVDLHHHYRSVEKKYDHLTPEEKNIVRELLGKEKDFEKIDWKHVQQSLPQIKPIGIIQRYYRASIDPTLKRGEWTEKEAQQLLLLVTKHGKNWPLISKMMGTRSERQCSMKYGYEICAVTSKIGRFSEEEDKELLDAVKKYGTESFLKIKESIKSQRSTGQLRHRYKYHLDPAIDRSPWTQEEKEQLYSLYAELKDARKVKERMGSKRSLKDIHSRLRTLKKRIKMASLTE